MGRIKKTPSERHTATVSPAITEFVQDTTKTPLHQLPSKLTSFPRLWPLPRGDLYHWIPLLDRFDHILELFNKEYALNEGPQAQPFERRLLEKGDEEEGMPYPAKGAQKQELDAAGYSEDGDRELVESIVYFTRLLLEHCGNRSLYASSGHINDLLHTTSLSLLKAALKLGLRLAQRYQVARYKNSSPSQQPTLLANHYNFNLDNLHKLAMPFPKTPSALSNVATTTPGKGKDKAVPASSFNPSDLATLAKEPLSSTLKRELANVNVTYYDQPSPSAKTHTTQSGPSETDPVSPTPVRRTSALGPSRDRPSAGDRSASSNDVSDTPIKSRETDTSNAPKTFQLPASQVTDAPTWKLIRDALASVPKESHYDLLNRIRIAGVFASSSQPLMHLLLEVRLLAIANLAYAVGESKFTEKIGQADAEEPRRFHLAQQLCDLLQPGSNGESVLTLDLETTVLQTLEALVRLKHKWSEVVEALAITVNHGILYYELRKAVATLHSEDHADTELELKETDWRAATFTLVDTVSQANPAAKYAERMLAAGVMDIEIEVLTLRTKRAERHQEKVVSFLDAYIHNISTSFQTLTALKGLEIVSDLAKYEVDTSLENLERGQGMPASYKSKVIDYDIPYYQQATLRSLFKFIVHLFDHSSGVHDRELRNLLDSPQMLGALRTVIARASVFGSNVWSGAVNTVSNFIHNEPTSFQVVAEAGLAKGILETITQSKLPDEIPADFEPKVDYEPEPVEVVNGEVQRPTAAGILPVGETICDIPTAFGAICLNENGMKLFQYSNALDKFFDMFVSPAHVRALEDDGMAAATVGQAFDELSRHHPQLKDQILAAVVKMVKKVRSVTQTLAEQSAVGGKLWKLPSGSHDAEVSGGVRAAAGHGVHEASARITASDINEDAFERSKATPYTSTCVKFLEGFFHNASMCQSFCANGGGEVVIDLATSPSNPADLVAYNVFSKMAMVVKRMCEEKPHLILPSLLARTQIALKNLKPVTDPSEPGSYFAKFTDPKLVTSKEVGNEGTTVVKALTAAHVLSHMLGRALMPNSTSARQTSVNQLFTSLNFTDVYVELVDAFSKLHSACLWENLALKEQFSENEKWRVGTDPKPFSPRRVNAEGFVELPVSTNSFGDGKSDNPKGLTASEIGESAAELFAFKNARAIRYLISQTPTGIESFFQNLGQVLLPKRTQDINLKQHAGLVADHLAKSALSELETRKLGKVDEAAELKYIGHVLHCMTRMLLRNAVNMEHYGSKEAVTLVLVKFYHASGFEKLQEHLTRFSDVLARTSDQPGAVENAAREGVSTILSFYSQIVRPKCINESAQSSLLSVRGADNGDYFIPNQFLVELRKAVLDTVTGLWRSDAITKMGDQNVKMIIEVLKFVLKAEGEERAVPRSEGATRHVTTAQPDFTLKHFNNVDKVKSAGFDGSLAREALYRCSNHEQQATEYAALRKNHNAPRFSIPGGDKETEKSPSDDRPRSVEMHDAGATSTGETQPTSSSQEVPSSDQDMSDDENFGSLGALPADIADSDMLAMGSGTGSLRGLLGANEGRSAQPPAEDTKMPFITVDDLTEAREQVRGDVIDRCLEVLSVQPNITFDLAELIQAAVAKSGETANPKAEIGNTLVSSLLSLQGEEGPESGLKISSYAHLVALIMQDRDFFDSTLDELKDNFDSFISWIQLRSDQKAEDAPWIEMLLLIMERVLAEDEQPIEVEWSPPSSDDPLKPLPQLKTPEPVVPVETRTQLFNTIVDLLPKIGKNSSLALSVTRVLVILTRRRDLASRLSEKMCLSRLFLMVRQLSGAVGEKLQSSFLLVLRHLVEDEQTIRQIMKTEIKNAFDGQRSMRAIDTTSYVRNLYHLVLRDPDMFVEVTQEMLEISRFDGHPNRAQTLALKPAPKSEDESKDTAEGKTDDEGSAKEQSKPTDAKSSDAKPAAVDATEGIVPFLLRELASYREVDDKPVPKKQESKATSTGDNATPAGDVNMPDATASDKSTEDKKDEKSAFKAEEHTIYIYKCFLLQCLSELLACYSRTKLEFINFSRKSESQPATPSKPRSGTLMYLLNALLPTGSLEHRDEIAHRKKQVTSNWATTVLVALCSQTQEKYHPRSANNEEDPDILFVRRFVLDHAIKVYKDATVSPEPLDQRYSKLLAIADLFDRMLSAKPDRQSPINASGFEKSRKQLGRLMYEKNLIAALTSSVAELDLNFPNAKRAVKHILVPLKTLTDLAVELSQGGELSSAPGTSTEDEDIASNTSASEDDSEDEREQTPDLYRNSALGIYNAEEDDEDDDDEDEDDDDMEDYEGYDEEMEFDEDEGAPPGEVVSDDDDDDDEDMEGMEGMEGMGPIEGLHGDRMDVEVIDESDDDDDDESGDEVDEDDEEAFDHDLEEVTGDDENASMADDMEEADWEDEVDDYDDEEEAARHGGPLDHIAQVLGDPSDGLGQDDVLQVDMGGNEDDEYFEDEMPPGDDEDDDEEDEIDYDGDVVYEPEHEEDEMDEMGWEWDVPPPAVGRGPHHHHRHGGGLNEFLDFMNADPLRPAPSRYHRGGGQSRGGEEEGTNPLLQRNPGASMGDRAGGLTPPFLARGARIGGGAGQNLIGDLVAAMNRPHGDMDRIGIDPRQLIGGRGGMAPVFAISQGGGAARFIDIDPRRPWREQIPGFRPESPRGSAATEEGQAVDFRPTITSVRWQEEARMLFGGKHHEKATRIIHSLLRLLLPAAMEAKKVRDKEEAERKEREEKAREEERKKAEAERKEREEREKKEREEREAKEAEEAAAKAREAAEAAANAPETTQATSMEGVEQGTAAATGEPAAEQAPPRERVTITIRGRDLDITELGIDREYIEALPEEFREDVIMSQFAERRASERAEARQTGEAPSEISREFLDALPPEIQAELLASEARDRRQREQTEARRQSRAQGGPAAAQPQDMDQVDFLATLDPGLRQTVLMEQDPDMLNLLPEELQREARELMGDRPRHRSHRERHGGPRVINVPAGGLQPAGEEEVEERQRYRPVVQMLDKPGVATLLRLMFVSLHHRAKTSLHSILSDVCKNTQNRAEVISILLSILQDGTADVGAVERSFAQLSLRAKQLAGAKTPQPLKRTLTGQMVTPATELSPLNIVQQCLGTLNALSSDNPKVQTFFLSEHETISSQKTKAGKKNKANESKAPKFPLNALLMLLDRKLITENTGVMETLAGLLSRVTHPLHMMAKRKEAEAKKEAEKEAEEAKKAETTDDVPMQEASAGPSTAAPAEAQTDATEKPAEEEKKDDKPETKKKRDLEPPFVPEENIRLVINILALRECPSRTFSDTLDIIKHLCAIPGAKEIFGKELIRQAQELGQIIVTDLEDLAGQIGTAKNGVDLQGMALAKFSSSGSQQRRLLQVLIALDHLFDPKRMMGVQSAANGPVDPQLKEDILTTLSESETFEKLWKNLSLCLGAIRQRGNMVNVATILLPLIETLFVVCRNSALKESTPGAVEVTTTSSPPPETRMEGLFFSFTEEHRKILNELIRNNPKLMNGNLSILAKNSKVLEFDNKRNYFNRKLHSRADRTQPHSTSLQLAVRRDHVFLDSYKALYYKSGEEIKNGKLNIRFNGEEGIDAGGVSREWFAVMARQMFNPDYALFNPVASDRTTFHPNKLSGINDEHLSFFKFIGRVIGKALYEGRLLDAHFSRAVYRRMLGKSVSLKDMETLDLDYYRSLLWILENDITDVTFETFSAEVEAFGVTETVDLVPGGRDIPVTEENKQEYVRLVVEHRLVKSVEHQLNAFLGGFHDIVPSELVSIFNENELELLISGLPDIDVDDWKNTTEYHNYQSTSPQIQWFWRAVKSFDEEERAKLLQFVTGTSKVPLNGFKELEGMNGFAKFNIHRDYSSKDKLPTSHTCFNQLDLPEYESYEYLRQQLYTAVTAGNEYFGFA